MTPPPLTLRDEALEEIQEAFGWYEEQRPGLGREFLDAVYVMLAAVGIPGAGISGAESSPSA